MEPRGIAPRSGLLISRTFITIVRRTEPPQYRPSFWLWEGARLDKHDTKTNARLQLVRDWIVACFKDALAED